MQKLAPDTRPTFVAVSPVFVTSFCFSCESIPRKLTLLHTGLTKTLPFSCNHLPVERRDYVAFSSDCLASKATQCKKFLRSEHLTATNSSQHSKFSVSESNAHFSLRPRESVSTSDFCKKTRSFAALLLLFLLLLPFDFLFDQYPVAAFHSLFGFFRIF